MKKEIYGHHLIQYIQIYGRASAVRIIDNISALPPHSFLKKKEKNIEKRHFYFKKHTSILSLDMRDDFYISQI